MITQSVFYRNNTVRSKQKLHTLYTVRPVLCDLPRGRWNMVT